MSRDEPGDGTARWPEDAVLRHADGQRPRPGEDELFAALDRTRAELASAPTPPLPPGFAARMQERLAAERAAAPDTTRIAPDDAERRPRRPAARASTHPATTPARASSRPGPAGRGRVLAVTLGALAVVAAVTGGVLAGTGPAPTAAPPPPGVPVPRISATDPVRALRAGLGAADPGPLTDPAGRAACLAAHGLPAATVPVGTRQVLLDGRPGTLLVLTTGTAARFRLLVVGRACTADRPDTLADLTVGG